jgi:capsule polysaccharide export protein KpsE/RkpR
MTNDQNPGILDYVVLLVKWKRPLAILAVVLFAISYLSIYFYVNEEYDAKATLIPTEEKQLGGISSIMKGLGGVPLSLAGSAKGTEMDLYTSIINSRQTLEKVIDRFDLLKDYGLTSKEKAVDRLRAKIRTRVTDENAYEIVVRASSAQKAADIANFVLEVLNKTVIEFNVSKSRNDRIFLEQRYKEMSDNLRKAEDSLQYYQEGTGMFEAKEQSKMIITAYSAIESELIAKQIELAIMENRLSKDSPQLENLRMEVKEYGSKLEKMKHEGEKNGVILALNTLPAAAKNYFRHFRDVEIYSKILEFLVPLYEQARFDEQKNVPVLQVIDYPVPPEKKSYPPRMFFGLAITVAGLIIAFFYILLNENDTWKNSDKVIFIKTNITKWRKLR